MWSKEKKGIWGWAMYDWANSAFATTVMAGFFPIFFKQYWSAGTDVNVSTAQLGLANSLASLFVALMAPIVGSIADHASNRKKFMVFFAYLGVLMTAALFLVHKGQWQLAAITYAIGVIGFSGANTFYDSLLPDVARKEKIDYVSGLGYGMGYIGGGLLFAINVVMVQKPELFGLADASQAVRFSFLTVAVWWGLFTLITIFWVEEKTFEREGGLSLSTIKQGLASYVDTFRKIKRIRTVFLFLAAFWFYIDGVNTIIRMAIDYGLSIGFQSNDLIIALLITQFVGFPAAILYGKLGEKWGVRRGIYLGIVVYLLVTVWGVMMKERYEFYVLAIVIGLVQGGIQALSRSYYSRLIPENQAGQFYGFYNMLGKFAAILGPVMIGSVGLIVKGTLLPLATTPEQFTAITQIASRWGIGSIALLFIIGGILLYFVNEEKAQEELALFKD